MLSVFHFDCKTLFFSGTMYDIYGLCRFEKAINYMLTSPWCAAFTKEDLQVKITLFSYNINSSLVELIY